jgi:glycine/D-amino acid oxidase-like deaminating enzyme
LRTTTDGRVRCGGGDEDIAAATRRDALLGRKAAWLQHRLAALLPGIDATPAFSWCGAFGASAHGLPTIGPVPGLRNCFAVLGYGGNGITFSMLAAQMLRNLLTGESEPDLDLVRFRARR